MGIFRCFIIWKPSSSKISCVKMDKIIALSGSSPQITKIDESKFVKFMTPIWDYFKITQQKYLSYTIEKKTAMINDYYKNMDEGEIFSFLFAS